ncbi:transglycosylase SLT domain-containing protein [Piscinibacter sp. Jin2]|uniref:Transglycosylase SLT domain-containing protein n=1 Tax=Aquariibacter lacus TaxID=2801332 RepID=A0A9X0XEC2_9BURK|nr:transglycosylase SLT domain-containing protein [Piscinibacter lacus]MBL0719976.1 transglycosylase SLT domain-containing protein [Piscinibacter lacus]
MSPPSRPLRRPAARTAGLLLLTALLGACAGLQPPPATVPPPQAGLPTPARAAGPGRDPSAPPAPAALPQAGARPAAQAVPLPAPRSAPSPAPQAAAATTLPQAEPAAGPFTAPGAEASTLPPPYAPADKGTGAGLLIDPLQPDRPPQAEATARQDLWERVRRGFRLEGLDGPEVEHQRRWYGSRPEYVQRMTSRASRYLFHIVDEVERRGLPSELALLPFIESAFNPQAMSSAKASGMWQFIPSTGRHFDLTQNLFRDDRRDVLASTQAALDYLQKLHAMFGDWHLALAAYNWGEGSVQRAIKRNQRAGLPTGYAHLRMPAETRHYVPKLLAVKAIISAPQDFGMTLPPIENHPYFLAVPIQRDIDTALVAELAELPLAEVQALNPSMNKPVILAAGTPQVLLPWDNAQRFIQRLDRHKGSLASWTAWVVPRTMGPGEAAERVGMPEAELRSLNRIPPRMMVKAGSTLLVPRAGKRDQDVAEHVAEHAQLALAPIRPPGRRVVTKARAKERTLAALAARHGLSAEAVAGWNGWSADTRLRPGQKVVLYLPAKAKGLASGKRPIAKARKAPKVKAAQAAGKVRKAARPEAKRKLAAPAR